MPGKRYAVLVANGTFGDNQPQLRKLRCPPNDLAGMKAVLSSEEHGGYTVTSIVDGTHDAARRAIYQCLKKAASEDLVLIYFSGHGKLDEDGNLYLVTKDTIVDELPPTSIPVDDIKKYLAESAAARKVVILDCCFSGAIKKIYKGEVADQASQAIRDFEGQGTFYLTASTDIQLAEEKEGDEYSLLTKHILAGIKDGKADTNDDGQVSFNELCAYIQSQVPKEGSQKPKAWYLEAEGDITLALTGMLAGDARRKAITRRLYELANQDLLTDDVVTGFLQILHRDPKARLGSGHTVKELTDSLYSKMGSVGQFLQEVVRCTDVPSGAAVAPPVSPTAAVATTPTEKASVRSVPPSSAARRTESEVPVEVRTNLTPRPTLIDARVKPPVEPLPQPTVAVSTSPTGKDRIHSEPPASAPRRDPEPEAPAKVHSSITIGRWLPATLGLAATIIAVLVSWHHLFPHKEDLLQTAEPSRQNQQTLVQPEPNKSAESNKAIEPAPPVSLPAKDSAVKEIPKPDFGHPQPAKVSVKKVSDTPARVRVSSGVASGMLIRRVNPAYPPLARQARIQGAVTLQAVISKEGTVESLQLVSGHPMLAPAAIEAVKLWVYKPYLLNGEPVTVDTQVVVMFTLTAN